MFIYFLFCCCYLHKNRICVCAFLACKNILWRNISFLFLFIEFSFAFPSIHLSLLSALSGVRITIPFRSITNCNSRLHDGLYQSGKEQKSKRKKVKNQSKLCNK